MLLKLAWRNLWRNRRRTLITAASVFFAVLLSTFMSALQEGVYEKMIDNMVGFYSGYVQVHKQGYWEEQGFDKSMVHSDSVMELIQAQPSVVGTVPRLESFALASSGELTKGVMVVGTDPEAENQLTNLEENLEAGTYFSIEQKEVLVSSGLAEKLQIEIGDTLVLIGQGYRAVSAAGKYPVRGILKFGSPELNQRLVYLPLTEAQRLYGAEGRLTSLALQLDNSNATQKVVKQLSAQLDTTAYEVMSWDQMMPEIVQIIEGDRGGNFVTIGILYLIIGFGLFGTMLMMTTERQYELGVMVAVGMRRFKLGLILLMETFFMTLIGLIAGSVVALPLVWYFNRNPIYMGDEMAEAYKAFGMDAVLPTSTDPIIFLAQAAVVFVLSLLVGLYPLYKVSRLKPVQAMRG
ncbi:MAG: ABC transporter permease [Bacteroidota bacterium]